MIFSIFKTVFLFVGAVIGAGFATGSEVMLYFGNSNMLTIILAGLLIGLFAMVFASFGKISNKYKWLDNMLKIAVFFSSLITFCIMVAASDEVMRLSFNIRYVGAATGVIVAFLMLFDMRIIKLLNSIIVPFIVMLFIVMLVKTGGGSSGDFHPYNSFLYGSMNMLLGGYMMTCEGKQYSNKHILIIGGIVAAVMTGLLSLCYLISSEGVGFSMPLFEVARRIGLGQCAGIVIYLAIFTTLIGSGRVMGDIMCELGQSKWIFSIILALVSVLIYSVDFKSSVSLLYPPIGWVGAFFTMSLIAVLFSHFVIRKHCKKLKRCRLSG